jgi:hypothetical protein
MSFILLGHCRFFTGHEEDLVAIYLWLLITFVSLHGHLLCTRKFTLNTAAATPPISATACWWLPVSVNTVIKGRESTDDKLDCGGRFETIFQN